MSARATSGGIGGAGATVIIDDIEATLKALEDFGTSSKDLRRAFRPASRLLARKARQLAPRADGYLKRSIRARPRPNRADVIVGGRSAYYAPVIHFGWHKHNIQPNHFMFRALDENAEQVTQILHESLKDLARAQGLSIK